jgi:hypothetical protein
MDGSATTRLPRRVAAGVAVVLVLTAAVVVLVLALSRDDGGFHAGTFEPSEPSATAPFTAAATGADPAVAAGSAAMVARALVPFADGANLAGSEHWGIPVVRASEGDPLRTITAAGRTLRFRIPDGATPSLGSDHHLAVIDGDRELDLWTAQRDGAGDWTAGAAVIVPASARGIAGPIAADAAGFALTAGLVTAQEVRAGRIDHALVFTTPYTRDAFVAPAVHTDGRRSDPAAMPMGTRIQLDPAADVTDLPRPQRAIARALQVYGAYLVDSSGSLAIRGITGLADLSLTAIPWSHMRVLAPQ